jgi:hypothetical protein
MVLRLQCLALFLSAMVLGMTINAGTIHCDLFSCANLKDLSGDDKTISYAKIIKVILLGMMSFNIGIFCTGVIRRDYTNSLEFALELRLLAARINAQIAFQKRNIRYLHRCS